MQSRKNQVDHVAQYFTHNVKRVQQLELLDFDQLKGLVSDEDLQASILKWNRHGGKRRKWYHLTHDAFINCLYEVNCLSTFNLSPTSLNENLSEFVIFVCSEKSPQHKKRQSGGTKTVLSPVQAKIELEVHVNYKPPQLRLLRQRRPPSPQTYLGTSQLPIQQMKRVS
jgi:hypothetical protein